jgi:hypothetical protein
MSEKKPKDEVEDVSESELDQLMEDLATEDTAPAEKAVAEVRQLTSNGNGTHSEFAADAEQSLKLELKGSINLKLVFSSGERSIEVFCAEEALICRMADGTEFKIPTGIHKKSRAA